MNKLIEKMRKEFGDERCIELYLTSEIDTLLIDFETYLKKAYKIGKSEGYVKVLESITEGKEKGFEEKTILGTIERALMFDKYNKPKK